MISGTPSSVAVFLDRDGTLLEDHGHLDDPGRVSLLSGVPEALRELRAAGFKLVLVSNQSGVGRGWLSKAKLEAVHEMLLRKLAEQGLSLDAAYYCEHAPEHGCSCRKPRPGLLLNAASDLQLDLRRCWMVGDKRSDAQAGVAAGARAIELRLDATDEKPWSARGITAATAAILASAAHHDDDDADPSGHSVWAVSPDELLPVSELFNAERQWHSDPRYAIPEGDAGHGIAHSIDQGLVFKRYRQSERQLAINALIFSSCPGAPIAQGRAILTTGDNVVLAQQFVQARADLDGLDQARAAMASLAALHDVWRCSLGLALARNRRWLWRHTSSWMRAGTDVVLDVVNFADEFDRRALRQRAVDSNPRLGGAPRELVVELGARMTQLSGPRDPVGVVHGDTHLGNQHGAVWFDFDHVRWGPLSYDAGRLLCHGVRFSYVEWNRLAAFATTLWPGMTIEDLLRTRLHHCLTLAGASLGAGRPAGALNYLRLSRDAAAVFELHDVIDAIILWVERTRCQ